MSYYSHVDLKVQDTKLQLDCLQTTLRDDPLNVAMVSELSLIQSSHEKWCLIEEKTLKQKAKIHC